MIRISLATVKQAWRNGLFPGRCPQSAQSGHDISLNIAAAGPGVPSDRAHWPPVGARADTLDAILVIIPGCLPAVFSALPHAHAGARCCTGAGARPRQKPVPHRQRPQRQPPTHADPTDIGSDAAQCKRLRNALPGRAHGAGPGRLHARTRRPGRARTARAASGIAPLRPCSAPPLPAPLTCRVSAARANGRARCNGSSWSADRWICAASRRLRGAMAWRAGSPRCRPTSSMPPATSGCCANWPAAMD